MSESVLHSLVLMASFWVAVVGFAAWRPPAGSGTRFVLGLALGALATHVGWAALHPSAVVSQPNLFLELGAGYTVLALPLGLLATAPFRAPPRARVHYAAAAFGALPLALAAARIGCLIAGCCAGKRTGLPWGIWVGGQPPAVHPTPLYELGAWLAVAMALRHAPTAWVAPCVLIAFGAVRAASELLRAAPPLGPPAISVWTLCLAWMLAGAALSPPVRRLAARTAAPLIRSPGAAKRGSRSVSERTTPSPCPAHRSRSRLGGPIR